MAHPHDTSSIWAAPQGRPVGNPSPQRGMRAADTAQGRYRRHGTSRARRARARWPQAEAEARRHGTSRLPATRTRMLRRRRRGRGAAAARRGGHGRRWRARQPRRQRMARCREHGDHHRHEHGQAEGGMVGMPPVRRWAAENDEGRVGRGEQRPQGPRCQRHGRRAGRTRGRQGAGPGPR